MIIDIMECKVLPKTHSTTGGNVYTRTYTCTSNFGSSFGSLPEIHFLYVSLDSWVDSDDGNVYTSSADGELLQLNVLDDQWDYC